MGEEVKPLPQPTEAEVFQKRWELGEEKPYIQVYQQGVLWSLYPDIRGILPNGVLIGPIVNLSHVRIFREESIVPYSQFQWMKKPDLVNEKMVIPSLPPSQYGGNGNEGNPAIIPQEP